MSVKQKHTFNNEFRAVIRNGGCIYQTPWRVIEKLNERHRLKLVAVGPDHPRASMGTGEYFIFRAKVNGDTIKNEPAEHNAVTT